MKTLAIVPARGGSKRLPRKNARLLAGKPLVTWTIEAALSTSMIDEVIVSTEDREIGQIAQEAGACVPWVRPKELAGDQIKNPAVVIHALNWFEEKRGQVDGVILLQPTSPFRTTETIERGINIFYTSNKRSVVSVNRALTHPSWCFKHKDSALEPYTSIAALETQAQNLETVYAANGLFYMICPALLRRSGTFYTNKMVPLFVEPGRELIDIDTEFDWQIASCLAHQN